jgi:hypothetical protein
LIGLLGSDGVDLSDGFGIAKGGGTDLNAGHGTTGEKRTTKKEKSGIVAANAERPRAGAGVPMRAVALK